MYKVIFVCCFVLVSFLSGAQSVEERNVGSFDEIKVGQAIKVYLHPAEKEMVKVESDNVDLDEIETEVEDGRLHISLSGHRYRNINVVVHVYYKSLNDISASSASSVFSEKVIRGDNFEISVSSAASVELKLDVNVLELNASSSGDARISGRAHEIEIEVSSAGSVNLYELQAEIGEVSASSAGSAKVYVTKSLEARASSGGSIRYSGQPQQTNIDSSSGGSVKKTN